MMNRISLLKNNQSRNYHYLEKIEKCLNSINQLLKYFLKCILFLSDILLNAVYKIRVIKPNNKYKMIWEVIHLILINYFFL